MNRNTLIPLALLAALTTGCAASPPKEVSATSATDAVTNKQTPAAETPEEPAKPDEPVEQAVTNMAIGSTLTIDTAQGSVQVQAVSTVTSTVAGNEFSEPPVNGVFVGVLMQYNCVTGPCDYNPFDYVLRGSDGAEYDQAFVFEDPTFEPQLQSGTLTTGVPAKGYVIYDVAPGTYSLEYRANFFDDDAASWTVPVA